MNVEQEKIISESKTKEEIAQGSRAPLSPRISQTLANFERQSAEIEATTSRIVKNAFEVFQESLNAKLKSISEACGAEMETAFRDSLERMKRHQDSGADVNASVNEMQVTMERMANLFADMIEVVKEVSTGVTELSEHDSEVQRSLKQRVQTLEQLTAEVETKIFKKCVDGCGHCHVTGTRYTRFGHITRDDFGDTPGGGEYCPNCVTRLTEVSGPEGLAVKSGGAV